MDQVRHQIFMGLFLCFTAHIIFPYAIVLLVSQHVNRTNAVLAIVGVQHKRGVEEGPIVKNPQNQEDN